MESQEELEEYFEGILDEFLQEENERESLEEEEAHKTNDLSSSMALSYT